MVNIVSLIQEIRNANVRGDNLLKIIRDKCPKIAYENIKLGNITLSYIHIACSELFEDEIPFESGKFQEFNWTNINNKEAIYIDPSEINKVITFGKKDNKKYVRFQFHELEEPKNNYIETFKKTNNLLFHFVVLEEEADLFESYLYALKDKLITIDLLKISDAGIKNLVSHEGKVSHVYNDAKGAKSYYCEEHKGHENIPEGKYKCSEKEHKNSKGDIGNPTIGVGHLIVGENELQKFCEKGTITDNEIEKLLKEDIVDKAEEPLKKAINECMKDAKLNQCQFDALLSIVFNRGIGCETCNNYPNGVGFKSSDLWKNYIKNGIFDSDDPDEKIEIKKKIINDGSILAGSKRRQDEAELYFNCKYKSK